MVGKTDFKQAIASIQSKINELLDTEITYFIQNIPSSVQPVLIYYHEQGGKRLRPALFYLLAQSFGSEENLGPYALAIELIHTMSLYHDDFIDGAEERRGSFTVHKNWDVPTAIIGGDILHSQIHQHVLHAAKTNRVSVDYALDFIHELTKAEVLIGCAVLEEMRMANSTDIPSLNNASKINARKTAPLFAFSAKMAAIVSDQNDKSQKLYDLGWQIGEAFQLLDDLLDYFPSNKDIGGDLREAKKTPLLILCHTEAPDYVESLINQVRITEQDVIDFKSKFSHIFLDLTNQIQNSINYVRSELFSIIEQNETINLLFDLLLERSEIIISEFQ